MDIERRKTKSYSFKKWDLSKLRELGALVTFPEDFRKGHGRLLSLLQVKVEKGCLETLVRLLREFESFFIIVISLHVIFFSSICNGKMFASLLFLIWLFLYNVYVKFSISPSVSKKGKTLHKFSINISCIILHA
jgi:hypothetical protein